MRRRGWRWTAALIGLGLALPTGCAHTREIFYKRTASPVAPPVGAAAPAAARSKPRARATLPRLGLLRRPEPPLERGSGPRDSRDSNDE